MGPRKERASNASPDGGEGRERRREAVPEEDACRCKQVAVMTPKQLLGTMLKDLAFWKKDRK